MDSEEHKHDLLLVDVNPGKEIAHFPVRVCEYDNQGRPTHGNKHSILPRIEQANDALRSGEFRTLQALSVHYRNPELAGFSYTPREAEKDNPLTIAIYSTRVGHLNITNGGLSIWSDQLDQLSLDCSPTGKRHRDYPNRLKVWGDTDSKVFVLWMQLMGTQDWCSDPYRWRVQ